MLQRCACLLLLFCCTTARADAPACHWQNGKLAAAECAAAASWVLVGRLVKVEPGPLAKTKTGCVAHTRYVIAPRTWEKGSGPATRVSFTSGTVPGKKGELVRVYGRGKITAPEILALVRTN